MSFRLYGRALPLLTKKSKHRNILEGDKVAGGMYATSTDGQVTGFRAGRLGKTGFQGAIKIDDPLKPSDAESDVMREHVNQQLSQTVRSRRAEPHRRSRR